MQCGSHIARIAAGQSDICLVGGAFNARREDMVLLFEMGGLNWTDMGVPVWQRGPDGGQTLGSMAGFLVLEDAAHARKRGVTPIAALDAVVATRGRREPGQVTASLGKLWDETGIPTEGALGVLSCATGVGAPTTEESAFLKALPNSDMLDIRAPGHLIGNGLEGQFPVALALAALCARNGAMYSDHGDRLAGTGTGLEANAKVNQIAVTSVGHWRGEGLGLVRKLS
jgi:3-oxoacyl-[acyl-carrier-protein] synthase II